MPTATLMKRDGGPGTVLITGSAGFIGSATSRAFEVTGWRTVGVVRAPRGSGVLACDLAVDDIVPILAAIQPDAIVHCAGPADIRASFHDPARDFRDSYTVTRRLLEAVAVTVPTATIVVCSSAAAIGGGSFRVPSEPSSPYGFNKRFVESTATKFAQDTGIDVRIARIYSAYGPGLRRQVVHDFSRQGIDTGRIAALGSGDERRDFIFVDDVAAMLRSIALSAALEPGAVVEIGTGTSLRIAELADMICRAIGPETKVVFTGANDTNSIPEMRADVELVRTLHNELLTPVDEGIRQTVDWLRSAAGPTGGSRRA